MKLIMVPVADRPECRQALAMASQLAERLDGNLVGCHLRPHRSEDDEGRGFRFTWRVGSKDSDQKGGEKKARLDSEAAQALFCELAEAHDFQLSKRVPVGASKRALWHEMVGSLEHLFSIVGPLADLQVVSRPKKNAKGRSADFLLSAILHGGRPVLVLPQRKMSAVGRRVVIAWNQSTLAARAVKAAMPLLQTADSVHIVSAGRDNRSGPKAKALQRYLAMWGVDASRESTPGRDPEAELEAVAKEQKCDLLVMGGYSRSRMRELVFGGVTQHMLFGTSLPVFILHS